MNEKQDTKVGAVWVRKTAKGDQLLSIQVELDGKKYDLVGFKNSFKKEDKHPSYLLYPSREKGAKVESKPKAQKPPTPAPEEDLL